jgi:hypothetical protein
MQRPRSTELVVDPHLAQWAVRVIVASLALFASALGVAILVSGPERFGAVTFAVALRLPGAPATWGATILLAGLITLAGILLGRAIVVAAGMLLAGAWCLLFASAFLAAQLQYPSANSTAFWIYSAASSICLIISGTYGATWRANSTAK